MDFENQKFVDLIDYNPKHKESLEQQVTENLAQNNFNFNLDGTIDARGKNF